MVPKVFLEREDISFKAKGVLAYLIGKPANWKVRMKDLTNHATEGSHAVEMALKELRKAGYIRLLPERGEDGRVKEWVWLVCNKPVFEGHFVQKGKKPVLDNPVLDNRPTSNTEGDKERIIKKTQVGPGSSTPPGALRGPHTVPKVIDDPRFHVALSEWIAYRAEQKFPRMGNIALGKFLDHCAKMGVKRAVAAIDHSIASTYKSVVEPRSDTPFQKPEKPMKLV